MHIYLPIAGLSVNVLVVLGIGGAVGMLSGMFGVGGGFLMTPLLIFIGIPPAVAVATGANQILASSVSGVIGHWRRGNVDLRMGMALLVGGVGGSSAGVWVYSYLRGIGQIDLVISLCYVVLLGTVGTLMLIESARTFLRRRRHEPPAKRHVHTWLHRLPFKVRFRRSFLYVSVLPPIVIGFLVGVLSAVMGVGGGFILVPAMIYILAMPTLVVIGTSLFQVLFVMADITVLQAVTNQTVDLVLALLLMASGVVGAQLGASAGSRIRADQLRGLLALLVLSVAVKIAFDLLAQPVDPFVISGFGQG